MSNIHCSPKLRNKVIIPARAELLTSLIPLENQISNLMFTTYEMIETLSYFISHKFRVNVYHSVSHKCPIESIIPVAEYFPEFDLKQLTPIHLTLISNPNSKIYLWNHADCELFFRQLTETLIHEMVHMRNSRKRKFKNHFNNHYDDDIIILSDPDCIDAYSYNISDDLEYSNQTWNLLRNPQFIKPEESLGLWGYMNTFNKDINHPVIKKLIKKVYKLLKQRIRTVDNSISAQLL